MINIGFCLLIQLLLQNSNSEPDTHVHLYIPPETGGGEEVFFFKVVEPFVPWRAFIHVYLSTRVLQTSFPGHLFERFALDG